MLRNEFQPVFVRPVFRIYLLRKNTGMDWYAGLKLRLCLCRPCMQKAPAYHPSPPRLRPWTGANLVHVRMHALWCLCSA